MDPEALRQISEEFLLFAALHHLAFVVLAVILWMRREAMARTVDAYFAVAFATAAYALALGRIGEAIASQGTARYFAHKGV